MTIQWVSNNRYDFIANVPASISRNNTATYFDLNYVPASIRISSLNDTQRFLWTDDTRLDLLQTSEGSFRFDFYAEDALCTNICQVVDAINFEGSPSSYDDDPRWYGNGIRFGFENGIGAAYVGTGQATTGTYQLIGAFELGSGIVYRVNIDWKHHASSGYIRIYVNEVLVAEIYGDTSSYPINNLKHVIFRAPNTNSDAWFSQFMWGVNESTVGQHIGQLTVSALGDVHNEWDNNDPANVDYDVLTDNDTNTTTSVADALQQYNIDDLTAYVMAQDNYIRGVHIPVWVRNDILSPQDMQISLRTNGGDYFSSTYNDLATGFKKYTWKMENNPATGVAFTKAEINASNIGFKAIAGA